jgi:hypothetical protein
VIDYSTISRSTSHSTSDDPLDDAYYFAAHRRAERKEKQLRNIEKERAMHEKVQLERLLEGLQGHDWLKVMGITGITDGERKDWEPKRAYFIAEVKALVGKFRIWKEEEKRLKLEKEAALHAQEEDEEDEDDDTEEEGEEDNAEDHDEHALTGNFVRGKAATRPRKESGAPLSPNKPQALRIRLSQNHSHLPSSYNLLPPPEPEPNKPFTSFYSKPHLRAAALGQVRHGRSTLALGHPIPEFEEHVFALPPEYLTPEELRDHARKKRRLKREKAEREASKGDRPDPPPV